MLYRVSVDIWVDDQSVKAAEHYITYVLEDAAIAHEARGEPRLVWIVRESVADTSPERRAKYDADID